MAEKDFYILMNAWWEPVPYTLPGPFFPGEWEVVVDTSGAFDPEGLRGGAEHGPHVTAGQVLDLPPRSTVVLRQV